MTTPEEFASHLRDHSFVHHATVVGEVVEATKSTDRNMDCSTFSNAADCGWTVVMHIPNDGGDMYLFAPLEWFE